VLPHHGAGHGSAGDFSDDRDRERFVGLLSEMIGRYCDVLHAYVLMGNHYHLLIETPEGTVSRALQ
jgi:REP element-mobilizing transposase RayT